MRLGATSLSATKPGAVRKYAAAGGGSSSTLPDIDTYTHVRFDVINTGSSNCMMVELSSDGTKLYTLHYQSSYTFTFNEQNLSTAFDSVHFSQAYSIRSNDYLQVDLIEHYFY